MGQFIKLLQLLIMQRQCGSCGGEVNRVLIVLGSLPINLAI